MLSRSQAFAAAFSAKKALLNVNATVNAKRTFTFTSAMQVPRTVNTYTELTGGPAYPDCRPPPGRSVTDSQARVRRGSEGGDSAQSGAGALVTLGLRSSPRTRTYEGGPD